MQSNRYTCHILMKLEFSKHISGKCSNIKINDNPSSGSQVVQRGRTSGQDANNRFLLRVFCKRA